jgi:hypothetical protein
MGKFMQDAFCDIIVVDKVKRLNKLSNNAIIFIIVFCFVY